MFHFTPVCPSFVWDWFSSKFQEFYPRFETFDWGSKSVRNGKYLHFLVFSVLAGNGSSTNKIHRNKKSTKGGPGPLFFNVIITFLHRPPRTSASRPSFRKLSLGQIENGTHPTGGFRKQRDDYSMQSAIKYIFNWLILDMYGVWVLRICVG